MDLGYHSPLIDLFLRGEAPRDVRLLAAEGAVAPRAHEQLALLALLSDDDDPDVREAARRTVDALPREALGAFLARPDVPAGMRDFFGSRAAPATAGPAPGDDPLVERVTADPPADDAEVDPSPDGATVGAGGRRPLSTLPITDRIKLAMRGSREQRAVLVRDTNRLVASAVLSSPRLTDTEVEACARMGNVAEEVLRAIATTRKWVRNYGVVAALVRNPKTPAAVSMPMVSRLNERDLRMLSVDRNVPEALRIAARKFVVAGESRRK
jgi:hypothetical protein